VRDIDPLVAKVMLLFVYSLGEVQQMAGRTELIALYFATLMLRLLSGTVITAIALRIEDFGSNRDFVM
jgi:hypothetical protein